jgi:hypothetical protein
MAHSSPVSVPAQVIAGVIAGEIAGGAVKEFGGGETAQRVFRAASHGLVSGLVGSIVNGALLDPVSLVIITPSLAGAGALAHYRVH